MNKIKTVIAVVGILVWSGAVWASDPPGEPAVCEEESLAKLRALEAETYTAPLSEQEPIALEPVERNDRGREWILARRTPFNGERKPVPDLGSRPDPPRAVQTFGRLAWDGSGGELRTGLHPPIA
jgi:hypothetical protein